MGIVETSQEVIEALESLRESREKGKHHRVRLDDKVLSATTFRTSNDAGVHRVIDELHRFYEHCDFAIGSKINDYHKNLTRK